MVFQFTEGSELETNTQEMWAEKSKENPIQMTRLIMAMESRLTFQKAIKPKRRIITEAIAKVAHKQHTGWGINNKETMNIAVDATVTFEQCFLILQNTDENIWKPGCIPLGELDTSRPCLGTGVTSVSYWRRNIHGLNEGLGTDDFLWWCNIVIHKKWKFHVKSGFIA